MRIACLLIALALAGRVAAEDKLSVARLAPPGSDFAVGLKCAEGGLIPLLTQLTFSARSARTVLDEESAKLAAAGIDPARITFVARVGQRDAPARTVTLLRGAFDVAKLSARPGAMKPASGGADGRGLSVPVGKQVLVLLDGSLAALGTTEALAPVQAAAAKGAGAEAGVLADLARVLQKRNGLVAVGRFPRGLAGELPPSIGKLLPEAQWAQVRTAAASLFEKDGEFVLGFESPDTAGEARGNAEKALKAWVEEAAKLAGASRKGTALDDAFAMLDGAVLGARLHHAALADFAQVLALEQRERDLIVRIDRARADWSATPAALAGAIATAYLPELEVVRRRSHFRQCYANQKTLAGAIEMYALDKNVKNPALAPELYDQLKKEGYLQSAGFDDPGQGPDTRDHYQQVSGGNGIRCTVHGDVEGRAPGTETMPPEVEDQVPPMMKLRADVRACHANQKTLAGAIEMYMLDKDVKQVTLDAGLLQTLKQGGYLSSIPADPGEGAGSESNYYQTPDGTIACRVHGNVDGTIKGSKWPQ